MVERQVRNGQEAADTKAFRLVGWDSARGEDPRLLKRPSSCDEGEISDMFCLVYVGAMFIVKLALRYLCRPGDVAEGRT